MIPKLHWTEWVAYGTIAVASYHALKLVRLLLSDADSDTSAALRRMPKSGAFAGKVCWIVGASSGIGEALAYELSKHGAKLVISARRVQALERIGSTCRSMGAKDVLVLPLDLQDFDSHKGAVQNVVSKLGRIDYLVNNAARAQGGHVSKTDLAVDKVLFETNFFGTISVTKAVLPHLLSQPTGGVIVTTSSVLGKVGCPALAIYAASKHALHGFFDSLRMELADRRVRVVTICPGPVQSEITRHALRETLDTPTGGHTAMDDMRQMPAARCAALMAAAMRSELPEAWIAPRSALFVFYIGQYLRSLYFLASVSLRKIYRKRSPPPSAAPATAAAGTQ